ncbi:pyrroline-5-carboxylate reductase [Candidatus Peregrinibacteria bacterium]|nr:pyrroline-5-carboxylate reductase [Candidatus Peregrinibacteria bacterium]
MKKIAIIGAGKMGTALAAALKKKFSVQLIDRNSKMKDCDIVILAVKPQDFDSLQITLKNELLISIMAGVSLKKLGEKTGAKKIVRSMPNLALRAGAGFTGWICKNVKEKKLVREIFSIFGEEIEVKKEEDLNAITALSGSGPAYFFHICELMAESAADFGFAQKDAEKIAANTLIGAAALCKNKSESFAELRKTVTSKGGTTEAALNDFAKNNLSKIFKDGVKKARARSKELNK